jgi:hypothetical protein
MIFFIIIIGFITINGCVLYALFTNLENFKESKKHDLNILKKDIFEKIRFQIQETNIEHESLKREFRIVKKQVDDMIGRYK